jgi:hypothetical protein
MVAAYVLEQEIARLFSRVAALLTDLQALCESSSASTSLHVLSLFLILAILIGVVILHYSLDLYFLNS